MASQSEPLSIGAAAEAYQVAMEEQARDAKATAQVTPQAPAELDNITPAAAAALSQASPAPAPPSAKPVEQLTTQQIPRTSTPVQALKDDASTSRATSQHPEAFSTPMPAVAPPHGAPARQYINSKITATLLEGMKQVARDQPPDPLRVLGEYLLQRSQEIEGSS